VAGPTVFWDLLELAVAAYNGMKMEVFCEWRQAGCGGVCVPLSHILGLWYPDRAWTPVGPGSVRVSCLHRKLEGKLLFHWLFVGVGSSGDGRTCWNIPCG
jgi:hypothetical protein